MLRRRRAHGQTPEADDLGARVLSVVWDDDDRLPAELAEARARAWRELRAIVAEAVIWQDAANDVLAAISRREPLAELAPRGGPLVRRFCELRARLPESDDPDLERITDILGPVLDHHALMLSSSLDMLAVDWRSERIADELERITGLGAPALRLEEIYAELAGSSEPVR
jgi:hypothetical protein